MRSFRGFQRCSSGPPVGSFPSLMGHIESTVKKMVHPQMPRIPLPGNTLSLCCVATMATTPVHYPRGQAAAPVV